MQQRLSNSGIHRMPERDSQHYDTCSVREQKERTVRNIVIVVIAAFLLSLGFAAHASDMVINIAGNQYGDVFYHPGSPTYDLTLSAGSWLFDLVCPEIDSRATYYAWCPWTPPDFWSTRYCVFDGVTRFASGNYNLGPDAKSAFWQSHNDGINVLLLNLSQTTTLHIGVGDSELPDNVGGISLKVASIPEPASILPLICGIGGMMLRRRK